MNQKFTSGSSMNKKKIACKVSEDHNLQVLMTPTLIMIGNLNMLLKASFISQKSRLTYFIKVDKFLKSWQNISENQNSKVNKKFLLI